MWTNIFINEERKLYTVLTDEEIGDGDTYILNDFMKDGWKLYCDTQHTADQAHVFMRRYTTGYTAAEYRVHPITFKAACAFVKQYHRHHMPPQGHKFSISLWVGDILAGVVIAGRPVSRYQDDGKTVEITRMCVKPGYRNGCSLLYARAARVAREMGYARMITYTLEKESGASLRAVGFQEKGISPGGSWGCKARDRRDKHPLTPKRIWELELIKTAERKKAVNQITFDYFGGKRLVLLQEGHDHAVKAVIEDDGREYDICPGDFLDMLNAYFEHRDSA